MPGRKTQHHVIGPPMTLQTGGRRQTKAPRSWWVQLDRSSFAAELMREQARIQANPEAQRRSVRDYDGVTL